MLALFNIYNPLGSAEPGFLHAAIPFRHVLLLH